MSKQTLVKEIKREISKLNDDIDMKIVRGVPYRNAARRHKFLVSQLRQLERRQGLSGIFSRMGRLVATFMF